MKLNRKLGCLIVAVASIGVGAAVAAAAETDAGAAPSPRFHHGHRPEAGSILVGALLRATKQLGLSAEQESSIHTLLSNARAQRKASMQSAPIDLTVLGNPGDPNYAAAVESAKALAASHIQQESELAVQIYNVLTAEQKAKLPQVLADLKAKFEQRRAAWQQQQGADTSDPSPAQGAGRG